MKTEIGGTFKWSTDQIEAYAVAFREGDAVKFDGKWAEVVFEREDWKLLVPRHPEGLGNGYALNYTTLDNSTEGVFGGFLGSRVESPYEIVSPKDYEVREGDKLVWLGESDDSRTFGMSYIAAPKGSYFNYKDDNERECVVLAKDVQRWGVIPRYENVKVEEEMNSECEHSGNVGKFKKGDCVRASGTDSRFDGCVGRVDNVHETRGEFRYHATFGDGDNCWLDADALELVEEEEMNKKTELVDEVEYSGKFKVGDRVRVKETKEGSGFVGEEGAVMEIDGQPTPLPYAVALDEIGVVWCAEDELEIIGCEKEEDSPEQEAFEYLLSQDKDATRSILQGEISIWANVHLEHRDYDDLRQVIDILEKLEKGE